MTLTPAQRALFEQDFQQAVAQGKLASTDREEALSVFSGEFREKILGGDTAGLLAYEVEKARASERHTFARGHAPGGPTLMTAPRLSDAEPPGLDSDGKQLHTRTVRAMEADPALDYQAAFARVVPDAPDVALGIRGPGTLPDSAFSDNTTPTLAEHQVYRSLARGHGIEYMDAMQLAAYSEQLAALEADDGASDVAWLDARPRATAAKPWSEDDYETDKRRAAAHNLDLGFSGDHGRMVWEAAVAEGNDPVAEAFSTRRAAELRELRDQHEAYLHHAQTQAGERRQQMIAATLDERARRRLQR
jgi:hypothetical protein